MSARSTTGAWVVASGPTLIGPFDGRSPAEQFIRTMKQARPGVEARLQRLHSPADGRRWVESLGT